MKCNEFDGWMVVERRRIVFIEDVDCQCHSVTPTYSSYKYVHHQTNSPNYEDKTPDNPETEIP